MNIGKRIELKLSDLKWERKQLLEAVPDLTPQALSNLIRRDSKRSEWDIEIAKALRVSLLWLVYGVDDDAPVSQQNNEHVVSENLQNNIYQVDSPQTKKVVSIMRRLPPHRQDEIAAFSEERLILESSNHQNSTQRADQ